jgi:hypothetical protein
MHVDGTCQTRGPIRAGTEGGEWGARVSREGLAAGRGEDERAIDEKGKRMQRCSYACETHTIR